MRKLSFILLFSICSIVVAQYNSITPYPTFYPTSSSGSSGSSTNGQLIIYTSGTPATPSVQTSPAMAYDPTGVLPTKGWSTNSLTWN